MFSGKKGEKSNDIGEKKKDLIRLLFTHKLACIEKKWLKRKGEVEEDISLYIILGNLSTCSQGISEAVYFYSVHFLLLLLHVPRIALL